jgi:hypothetical protein
MLDTFERLKLSRDLGKVVGFGIADDTSMVR